jgi:hypothetical protein
MAMDGPSSDLSQLIQRLLYKIRLITLFSRGKCIAQSKKWHFPEKFLNKNDTPKMTQGDSDGRGLEKRSWVC